MQRDRILRPPARSPSEDRDRWFKALAETIATPIFLMRSHVLFANPAALELCGYSLEELRRLPTDQLIHPDQREETVARFQQRLQGGPAPSRYEMKVLRRDGGVRWIDYSATLMEFEGQTVVLATAFDVTQRRFAEQALRNSEARLRLTLEQLPAVLWTVDSELRLTSARGTGMSHLGMPETGLEGMSLFEYFQTDEADFPAIDAHRRALTGESVTFELQWLGACFQSRVDPLRDDKGEIIGAIGLSLDITERKRAEIALRDSEERLRLAQRAGRSVTWEWEIGPDVLEVSEDATELFGIPQRLLRASFDRFFEYFGPEALALMRRAVDRTLDDDADLNVELPMRVPGREVIWLSQRGRAIRDDRQRPVRLLGVATDITEQRRANDALFQEKERAQVTLASIADAVIRTDAEGRVDFLNPVAAQLTGWQREEAVHKPVGTIYRTVDEETGEPMPDQVASCLREQRIVPVTRRRLLVRHDGMRFAIRDSVARIRDRAGDIVGAVLVFQDITELRGMEQRMERMASHDPLTDLINRGEFERRLEDALESARQKGLRHVVGYLDLDEFKLVNDTCGHTAGDELLKQISHLICSKVGSRGVVSRLGGDEFGLLFTEVALSEAREITEQIRGAIREHRFTWDGQIFDFSVSIGLVPISAENKTVAELLSAADGACYVAKDQGRNRIHAYRPGDQALAQRYGEMQWVHRIHKAFEEDRFLLYHQPIQPLSNGHHPLSEIFIRMVGEDGKIVAPVEFIPAAERYHLISTIDRWVLRTALQTLPRLRPRTNGSDLGDTVFNINLSGQSIGEESFLEEVLGELAASPVQPERICFEITETAAIGNLVAAMRFFHAVREVGCRFILDDFGSGLSSFAYLKNLPVDFLKIDGEFVRNLGRDPVQRVLVESIQRIGEVMGIQTIGECVENEASYRVLQELGVDYAQGYWIARPSPLE